MSSAETVSRYDIVPSLQESQSAPSVSPRSNHCLGFLYSTLTFPFLEVYLNEITHYILCRVRLLSFDVFFKSIHVVNTSSSFLLLCDYDYGTGRLGMLTWLDTWAVPGVEALGNKAPAFILGQILVRTHTVISYGKNSSICMLKSYPQ